jgi:hypothetical protein
MTTATQITDPEQFTDAQLSDGTTLRFKGQLGPDEVRAKVRAYREKQNPPKPTTAENPIERKGKTSTLGTVAREGMLGIGAGVGLPETTHASDFSLLPGLKTMVTHPIESTKLLAGGIVRPMAERLAKGTNLIQEGGARNIIEGGANLAAGIVPIVGPAAYGAGEELGEGIKTRDPAAIAHGGGAALGTLATLGLGTKRGGALTEKAISTVGGRAETALRAVGRAPLKVAEKVGLRVPEAPKALRQAIQPGINIPRAGESIDIAGPRLQQIAKSEGIDLTRVTKEKGEVTGKFLDLVKRGKQQIHAAIEQRLGPVDQLSPDTSAIADAMEKSISGRTLRQRPQVAQAIRDRAATYRGNTSLREIENAIEDANKELRGYYKQPVSGESPISPQMDVTIAEVKALRKMLDEKVESLSGSGVKELKREYGALRDVERATARQHAVQTRVKGAGLWEGLAALHAAGDFISGNALGTLKGIGTLAVGRRLQLVRNPDFLIEQAFQGNRPFVAAPPITQVNAPQIYADQILGQMGRRATNERMLPPRTSGPVEGPGPIPVTAQPPARPMLPSRNVRGLLPSSVGSLYWPPTLDRPLSPAPGHPTSLGAAVSLPVSLKKRPSLPEPRVAPPPEAPAPMPPPVKAPLAARTLRSTPRSESLSTYNSLPEEIRQAIDAQAAEHTHQPQSLREAREQQLAKFGGKGSPLKERMAREAARDEGLPILGETLGTGLSKTQADIRANIERLNKQYIELGKREFRMRGGNLEGKRAIREKREWISTTLEGLREQLKEPEQK